MFDIHHRRHFFSTTDRGVMAERLPTLEAAKNARFVSGDLVVYSGTNDIVPSEEWLWDWEKKSEHCYAKNAIKHALDRK
jgi:hypothetical protein